MGFHRKPNQGQSNSEAKSKSKPSLPNANAESYLYPFDFDPNVFDISSKLERKSMYLNICEEIETEAILLIKFCKFIQAWDQLKRNYPVQLEPRCDRQSHQLTANESSDLEDAWETISEISVKVQT